MYRNIPYKATSPTTLCMKDSCDSYFDQASASSFCYTVNLIRWLTASTSHWCVCGWEVGRVQPLAPQRVLFISLICLFSLLAWTGDNSCLPSCRPSQLSYLCSKDRHDWSYIPDRQITDSTQVCHYHVLYLVCSLVHQQVKCVSLTAGEQKDHKQHSSFFYKQLSTFFFTWSVLNMWGWSFVSVGVHILQHFSFPETFSVYTASSVQKTPSSHSGLLNEYFTIRIHRQIMNLYINTVCKLKWFLCLWYDTVHIINTESTVWIHSTQYKCSVHNMNTQYTVWIHSTQ